MPALKHIVICAGEESGDHHAAVLARQLLKWDASLRISGVGGHHMQTAGVELLSDLARFGVTGLSEVLRHWGVIRKTFKRIKNHLRSIEPDLLILVDYPGFNLRLAKYAKQTLGLRVIYYISPQIWAWKMNRIHGIRANVDKMAVIFPFEKELYEKAGVSTVFVGHPLVKALAQETVTENPSLVAPSLKGRRLVAMLPGSRLHEIERHMPILVKTAINICRHDANIHIVIPIASSVDEKVIEAYFKGLMLPVTFIKGYALQVMAQSDCVVVASGTAALECALLAKPMCVIYKSSLLTYLAAAKVIRVRYLSLSNILCNRMITPELLQYDCNEEELSRLLLKLLNDERLRESMVTSLKALKASLSMDASDCSLFELIKNELGDIKTAFNQ